MPASPVNDVRAAGTLRHKASTSAGPADEFQSDTLINPAGLLSIVGNQGSDRWRVYGDGRGWTPLQPSLPGSLVAGQYFIETIAGVEYWAYVDSSNVPHYLSGPGGSTTQVQFNDGGAFAGDSGLTYNKTTDTLSIGTAVLLGAGSAAVPAFSFTGDPDTGLYSVGANDLGVTVGGTLRLDISSTTIQLFLPVVSNENVTLTDGSKIDADNLVVGDGSTYIGKFTYSGSNFQLGSYSSVGLQFDTNGAVRMELDVDGNVAVGTGSLLTTSTDGFLYIPTTAGVPTGVPSTKTGRSPLIIDSSGNKFYFYNSGWQSVSSGLTGTAASTEIAVGSGATSLTHNAAFTIAGTAMQAVSTSANATVQIDAINSAATGTSTLASIFAGNSATIRANLFSYGPASSATVAGTVAANSVALGATGGALNVFYGSVDGLGTPTIRFVSAGSEVFNYTTASIVAAVPLLGPAGAVGAPSFSLSGDPDTGLYSPGANSLAVATNGTLRLTADALGSVVIGAAAILTTATDGFLYVPTCAGTPTGVPTVYTGRSPIVIDSTTNKLYFYSSGAWRDAGP